MTVAVMRVLCVIDLARGQEIVFVVWGPWCSPVQELPLLCLQVRPYGSMRES